MLLAVTHGGASRRPAKALTPASPKTSDAAFRITSIRGALIGALIQATLAAGLAGCMRADLTLVGRRNDANGDRAHDKQCDHDQPGQSRS
ncbi:MAG: hypothetical protein C0480_21730 [Bradyrhizobium sp.]|nr:hypothetical protein [Bradyrhizobium sp.]